jgi:hypothetical protein
MYSNYKNPLEIREGFLKSLERFYRFLYFIKNLKKLKALPIFQEGFLFRRNKKMIDRCCKWNL